MNGCFLTADPEMVFDIHAATLAGGQRTRHSLGYRGRQRSMTWCEKSEAAKEGGYEWVSSPFYLDLALRKPTVA